MWVHHDSSRCTLWAPSAERRIGGSMHSGGGRRRHVGERQIGHRRHLRRRRRRRRFGRCDGRRRRPRPLHALPRRLDARAHVALLHESLMHLHVGSLGCRWRLPVIAPRWCELVPPLQRGSKGMSRDDHSDRCGPTSTPPPGLLLRPQIAATGRRRPTRTARGTPPSHRGSGSAPTSRARRRARRRAGTTTGRAATRGSLCSFRVRQFTWHASSPLHGTTSFAGSPGKPTAADGERISRWTHSRRPPGGARRILYFSISISSST